MAGYLRRLVDRATVGGASTRALAPAAPPTPGPFEDPFAAAPVSEAATTPSPMRAAPPAWRAIAAPTAQAARAA
ncbi:MAG: hypothetical protein K8W52_17425, partial [Deltaproteobacteria bacterium]|nr:hypothetical protein [Deltaproteobacteria bacterium]